MDRIWKPKSLYTSLWFLFLLAFGLGTVSRLLFWFSYQGSVDSKAIGLGLVHGLLFDSGLFMFLAAPVMAIGSWPGLWRMRWFQLSFAGLLFVVSGVLLLATASEVAFVREFNARYNFIAVDYLVYTNEVLRNIWESYPLEWILPALFSVHLVGFFGVGPKVYDGPNSKLKVSLMAAAFFLGLWVNLASSEASQLDGVPTVQAEISKNPIYTLFAAYRNNEIDFQKFYRTIGEKEAVETVYNFFASEGVPAGHQQNEDQSDIVRNIERHESEKHLNVVLVLMESMSAKYLGAFGSKDGLTPNLDRLAREGLSFNNVFSTGTRTVRGIEAVALSIPPTPGQSIIRRPKSESIFNVGTVFREKGYHTQFVYGGRAVFDNMGHFFSSNGFEVLDQSTMADGDIEFSNAWGVCDEDLFKYAIKSAGKAKGKPFFQFILTTSNHRPYTYPDGRIDIPSFTGRSGAIKYSDYAIGQLLKWAEKEPWYKDTIFIFVADHNAAVAGGTRIIPSDYHIPMIFYSPAHIRPQQVAHLGSQIDLVPTLFGLMNFSYQSRFFGVDLLRSHAKRAYLATYQDVGQLTDKEFTILSPNQKINIFSSDFSDPRLVKSLTRDDAVVDASTIETIAFFEAASHWFTDGHLQETKASHNKINIRSF